MYLFCSQTYNYVTLLYSSIVHLNVTTVHYCVKHACRSEICTLIVISYVSADTKPSIAQLMRLKTAEGEKVEIIKSLTPQWRQLGLLMDFDDEGRTVDLIKAEYQSEGQTVCCQEVFKLWLRGPDATWGNLIELLIDCEQTALAEQVKDALGF